MGAVQKAIEVPYNVAIELKRNIYSGIKEEGKFLAPPHQDRNLRRSVYPDWSVHPSGCRIVREGQFKIRNNRVAVVGKGNGGEKGWPPLACLDPVGKIAINFSGLVILFKEAVSDP